MSDAITLLSEDRIKEIVKEALREVLAEKAEGDGGYMNTAQAAVYLNTTVRALHAAIFRGHLIPDHRGSSGSGFKGHRFTRETLDAFCGRRRKT